MGENFQPQSERNQEEAAYMSSKNDLDNHANQLNPNNDAYRSSRGWGREDDDDEEPVSSFASRRSPVVFQYPEFVYPFTIAAISVNGDVVAYSVSVKRWGVGRVAEAAGVARTVLSERIRRDACRRWVTAYAEVRHASGELAITPERRRFELHRHSGSVTKSLLERIARTRHYRVQSNVARQEYLALIKSFGDAIREMLKTRPATCRQSTWQRVRQDLQNRFGQPETVLAGDFSAAVRDLQELGFNVCELPSSTHVQQMIRRHDVLFRASVRRSPQPDENTCYVDMPRPDRYVEYFEDSPAKAQLLDLDEWFSHGQPALVRYLEAVEQNMPMPRTELGEVEDRY